MFTGIITHIGRIAAIDERDGGRRLEIRDGLDPRRLDVGASVAHSGICLTVTEKTAEGYAVYASPETLARTTMHHWQSGDRLNIEGSLRLGDELGGHLVFGHVDGIGRIAALERQGESWRLAIGLPPELRPLVAVKGSIAVDGISLTVNEVSRTGFAVMIIPHTWEATTLQHRQAGDPINLEADMLARYVARQLAFTRDMDR